MAIKRYVTLNKRTVEQMYSNFKEFDKDVSKDAAKKVIAKAVAPMLRIEKRIAPKRTGLLRKSLGVKKVVLQQGEIVSGLIGSRRSVKELRSKYQPGRPETYQAWYSRINRRTRLRETGYETRQHYIIPSKYYHLVVTGTKHSKADDFPLRAFESTKGKSTAIAKGILEESIDQAAAKIQRRNERRIGIR